MGTYSSIIYPRMGIYAVGPTPSAGPFAIPFSFQDEDEVRVFIDLVEETNFTITKPDEFATEGNFLTFDIPVSDVTVVVWGETGGKRMLAENFTLKALSKEVDRVFALVQELQERSPLITPDEMHHDGNMYKYVNLAFAENYYDAVPLGQMQEWFGSLEPGKDGQDGADGAATFLELTDAPNSFAGEAGKLVSVTLGEDAVEFIDPRSVGRTFSFGETPHANPGVGDMFYCTVENSVGLYVFVDDGNSSQWVQANGGGVWLDGTQAGEPVPYESPISIPSAWRWFDTSDEETLELSGGGGDILAIGSKVTDKAGASAYEFRNNYSTLEGPGGTGLNYMNLRFTSILRHTWDKSAVTALTIAFWFNSTTYNEANTGDERFHPLIYGDPSTHGNFAVQFINGQIHFRIMGDGSVGTPENYADGQDHIVVIQRQAGGVVTIRVDGEIKATGALSSDDLDTMAVGDFGGYYTGTSTNLWVGDLGEFAMYNRSLTNNEVETLEGYLAHKWGFTGNLPAGHTYKTVVPDTTGEVYNKTPFIVKNDAGVDVLVSAFDFEGNGVSTTFDNDTVTVNIPGGISDAPSDGKTYGRKDAAWAEVTGGGGNVAVDDDGTQVLAAASRLNFTGAGVTVSDGGAGSATINIPGGGGGGGADAEFFGANGSAAQNLHTAGTTIIYDNVYKTCNFGTMNTSTGVFTFSRDAVVFVHSHTRVTNGNANDLVLNQYFQLNGANAYPASYYYNIDSWGGQVWHSHPMSFSSGDTLQVKIDPTPTNTLTKNPGGTWLSIVEVGAQTPETGEFKANLSATVNNVTGDNTVYIIEWDNVVTSASWCSLNTTTGVFTLDAGTYTITAAVLSTGGPNNAGGHASLRLTHSAQEDIIGLAVRNTDDIRTAATWGLYLSAQTAITTGFTIEGSAKTADLLSEGRTWLKIVKHS